MPGKASTCMHALMLPRLVLLLPLTLLGACASPDIEPQDGAWTYEDVILSTNTCKDAPGSAPDGEFELTRLSGDRFTIDADELQNALDCSRDGDSFICEETLLAKISVPGVAAELLLTVEVTGTLETSQRFTAQELIRQSCTGADCAMIIASQDLILPCEYTFKFTGSAK